jgi:AcrR family transcriptional regulator
MGRKPTLQGTDRRQRILEAGLQVFAEQGFEPATTKEIAERAGVNQGLIYFYFESKADLFLTVLDHYAQLALAQLDFRSAKASDEPPEVELPRLLERIFSVLNTPRYTNLLRMMDLAQMQQLLKEGQHGIRVVGEHIVNELKDYLNIQVARRRLEHPDTELVAHLMTRTLIASILTRKSTYLAHVSQHTVAQTIASLFVQGLLPREESCHVLKRPST